MTFAEGHPAWRLSFHYVVSIRLPIIHFSKCSFDQLALLDSFGIRTDGCC